MQICLLKLVSDAFAGTKWSEQRTVRDVPKPTPVRHYHTTNQCKYQVLLFFCFFGFFSPGTPEISRIIKITVSPHHTTCIVSTFLINTFLVQLNVMVCQCVCLYLNVSGHKSTYPQHHHGHPCENTFFIAFKIDNFPESLFNLCPLQYSLKYKALLHQQWLHDDS